MEFDRKLVGIGAIVMDELKRQRRVSLVLSMILLTISTAWSGEIAFKEAFDPAWAQDKIWDDGKAEVATYAAARTIYGKAWLHEETRILVAEPMRTDQHVKPEWPYEGKPTIPVLKYNIVTRIETFNYPYQLMTSLFVDRAGTWRPIKAVYSSQEWCGTTFKDLAFWGETPRYFADSYWEDQAVMHEPMEWGENYLLADQLAVSLRAMKIGEGDFVRAEMLPSEIGNKAFPPRVSSIQIGRIAAESTVEAAGRTYSPAEQVVYRADFSMNMTKNDPIIGRFVFAAESPRVLLQYELRGGHSGTLKEVRRWAYWDRNER
jgi:hypothetical protein